MSLRTSIIIIESKVRSNVVDVSYNKREEEIFTTVPTTVLEGESEDG